MAVEALKAGKHLVIEKPMALTRKGCDRILFEALRNSRLVFGVMQNRYSPPAAWLKEVITHNLLGAIYMVQVNCFWNRDERYYTGTDWHGTADLDGGTLFTQFSHFIDILYWLFGDLDILDARFANFNHQATIAFEDSGVVSFRLPGGGLGSLCYSTSVWDKNLESSMTIVGEHGSVQVSGQYMEQVSYCHIRDYAMPQLAPTNPPNNYGPFQGSAANHGYVYENIVDTLLHQGSITTNALEGLKVVEIIEKVYQFKPNLHPLP
jgi:predicted dehydrogenase